MIGVRRYGQERPDHGHVLRHLPNRPLRNVPTIITRQNRRKNPECRGVSVYREECLVTTKTPPLRGLGVVAGAGFEPATFGL